MEDQYLSIISSTLDKLDKATSWALVALVAAALSSLQRQKRINIAGFEIDKEYAGGVMFVILCGLNFQSMRLLQNLRYLYDQTSLQAEATLLVRTHPWFFNPFSETTGLFSQIADNIGFALLLLLWWLGFHTGFFLLRGMGGRWNIIGIALSQVYLILGLISIALISPLMREINTTTWFVKHALFIAVIPVGAFGIGSIFRRIQSGQPNY